MNIYLQKKQKKINSVSVTITVTLAVIGYLLWFAIPTYWPIFRMTGIMKSTCNEAFKVIDEDRLMRKLLIEAKRTKLKLTKNNFRMTRTPFTVEELEAKTKDQTQWPNIRKRGKECVLDFYYEDDYEWPLIGAKTHLVFERQVVEPMEAVTWEKTNYDCTCVHAKR